MRSVQDEDGYNQGWTGGLAHDDSHRAPVRSHDVARWQPAAVANRARDRVRSRRDRAAASRREPGMQVLGLDVSEASCKKPAPTPSGRQRPLRRRSTSRTPTTLMGARSTTSSATGSSTTSTTTSRRRCNRCGAFSPTDGRIIFLEPNLHNPYVYLIFSRPKLRQRARLEPDEMAFSRTPRDREPRRRRFLATSRSSTATSSCRASPNR